jgi:hypothetical protein
MGWESLLLLILSSISISISLFVIYFIYYRQNIRLFDQLSLHLACSDLLTTFPFLFPHPFQSSSKYCHAQVYIHQFGMLNKAIVIFAIALLVVSVIQTGRLPNQQIQRIGYTVGSLYLLLSMIMLISFDSASLLCHEYPDGEITEIFEHETNSFLIYLLFYSMILIFCGIGSALMLIYLYVRVVSVWVSNESFHRTKLRFLIQRLKWYPIVFITSGIPRGLALMMILCAKKVSHLLLFLDLLSTPFLGISLSLIYLYWTLHNYYQQLFHERHQQEITSFTSHYDATATPRGPSSPQPQLSMSLSQPSIPSAPQKDYLTMVIINFLTFIHSHTTATQQPSSPSTSQPTDDRLLLSSPHPHSHGNNTSSGTISSNSIAISPPTFLSHFHSSDPSADSEGLQYIPPLPKGTATVAGAARASEIQLSSSFSSRHRWQHSSEESASMSNPLSHTQQPTTSLSGHRYQPTRISLMETSRRSYLFDQSIHEDREYEDDRFGSQALNRPTESRQKDSLSLSLLMQLTSGFRPSASSNSNRLPQQTPPPVVTSRR